MGKIYVLSKCSPIHLLDDVKILCTDLPKDFNKSSGGYTHFPHPIMGEVGPRAHKERKITKGSFTCRSDKGC